MAAAARPHAPDDAAPTPPSARAQFEGVPRWDVSALSQGQAETLRALSPVLNVGARHLGGCQDAWARPRNVDEVELLVDRLVEVGPDGARLVGLELVESSVDDPALRGCIEALGPGVSSPAPRAEALRRERIPFVSRRRFGGGPPGPEAAAVFVRFAPEGEGQADCAPDMRGGEVGAPCESPSACPEFCCACSRSRRYLTAAACVGGACAPAAVTCELAERSQPGLCAGEGEAQGP